MHPKHCCCVLGAKHSHLGPIFNFVCWSPAPVVSRPGKVVKIWLKHSSAALTGNDKNHTPKSVGMFRVQNQVICPNFTLLLHWSFLGPEKSSKFNWNILQPYGREMIRTTPQQYGYVSGEKPIYADPIFNFVWYEGVRARNSSQNSTETIVSHTNRKR